MPKQATTVVLSEQEEQGLLQITRRHRSEQQVVLRAHIVLAAAQGSSNAQIARDLHVNIDTVRLWRDRWAGWQNPLSGRTPVSHDRGGIYAPMY